jgi:hypothetical protein
MGKPVHEDVEFHCDRNGTGNANGFVSIHDTWEHALDYMSGFAGVIDVVIWSPEGASAYGGDDAVDTYNEDPEASVFERWIREDPNKDFDLQGMVP